MRKTSGERVAKSKASASSFLSLILFISASDRRTPIKVFVKVDPDSIELEAGFTRDVRNIGHFGTGDLEIIVTDAATLEKAKPLMDRSYDGA